MGWPVRAVAVAPALALAVAAGCAGRDTAAPAGRAEAPRSGATPWLSEVAAQVGLDFVHEPGAAGHLRLPEIMGGGVALLDYDGDGDLDVYLTNGSFAPEGGRPGPPPRNRLYRQEPGGRFTDVTDGAGLGDEGYGMGVAVGDVDNDGDLDVYVTNDGPDRLYRNRGDGTFEDATAAAGIDVDGWSTSATFCDYDRDGWLDLFVARYLEYDPRRRCTDAAGRPEYCAPKEFRSAPDVLLHNENHGAFADVSRRAGIDAGRAAGLGVVCADVDADGWPDFYVANDLDPNQLWINQRDGTFRDRAIVLGVAYNLEGLAESSMGVLAEDWDGDLDPDLFVTNLTGQTNTLYRNRGGSKGFDDVTGETGLALPSLPYTGFGTAALDIELDGDLDLAVVNGRIARGEAWGGTAADPPWDRYAEPASLFLNDGSGRFAPAGPELDAFTRHGAIGRGLAVGDVDGDGDVDLLVSSVHGPVRLYLDQAPRRGAWLLVRAFDPRLHRDALGAEITVSAGGVRRTRTARAGFGYLSSSDSRAHFGLGPVDAVQGLEVRWPDGLIEAFPGTPANAAVTLVRGTGRPR